MKNCMYEAIFVHPFFIKDAFVDIACAGLNATFFSLFYKIEKKEENSALPTLPLAIEVSG